MFFYQGNKKQSQDIRMELERAFGCPFDFMVRNYNYSWLVYSVRGSYCQISDEYASLLSEGRSENPRINKIVFTKPLATTWVDEVNAYTYVNKAIEEMWKVNIERLYGNWNFYIDGSGPVKETPLESKQKVNWKKLRLLYWAYFIKYKEKAF